MSNHFPNETDSVVGLENNRHDRTGSEIVHVPLTDHPADVERIEIGARIVVTASTVGRTGVEMEAITGAAIGAVTLYDMIKGLDRGAEIGPIRLLAKRGGASGEWTR